MLNAIEELALCFTKLPGLGKKNALRYVNYLLRCDKSYVENLSSLIASLRQKVRPCTVCNAWSEEEVCPTCSDSSRDRSIICVVSEANDVEVIKGSSSFNGLFHVLGGQVSPLNKVGPADIDIEGLVKRVSSGEVKEVILALNPTDDGDMTALCIQKILSDKKIDVKVSRLAIGIPIGGNLEFIDKMTLERSIRGRERL